MQILVLNASALHLGFLGCYGNAWVSTPNLDWLASQSVVFDQHFAADLGASRSASPLDAILHNKQIESVHLSAKDLQSLESTLAKAVASLRKISGRANSICWLDLPSLHPPWDISADFTELYLASSEKDEGEEDMDDDEEDLDNDEDDMKEDDGNEAAENEEEIACPLEPLLSPPIGLCDVSDLEFWERLRSTYAAAVTQLDAALGTLFEKLQERELFDGLLLVFTADRGLALGEHGIVGNGRPWLHDEVVHLPLIVRQPGGADAGRRVFALTQPQDLSATLIAMLQSGSSTHSGRSLLPLLRGEGGAIREHCISTWELGDEKEMSLRTLDHALLLPIKQTPEGVQRPVQFFLKPEDRCEANNMIQHHLDLADQLEQTLRGHSESQA